MGWGALAERQGGAITRAQLQAAGASARVVTGMVRRGDLRAVGEGVFLARGAPLGLHAQIWIAHLTTRGVIGFESAAQLWGMRANPPDRVHVCVDHPRRTRAPGWVRLHRVAVPSYAVRVLDDLPLTARWWTALDVVGYARPTSAAMTVADRAVQQGWLTPEHVADRLRRWPGRSGNATLRRLRPFLGDGAAAHSERLLHRILRRGEITGWIANFPLWSEGCLVAVLDVAVPERLIAIEVDGFAYHSDAERFAADRSRQNRVVGLGWTVLRFTWADVSSRPNYVLGTIRAALSRSGAQMDASGTSQHQIVGG